MSTKLFQRSDGVELVVVDDDYDELRFGPSSTSRASFAQVGIIHRESNGHTSLAVYLDEDDARAIYQFLGELLAAVPLPEGAIEQAESRNWGAGS